MPGDRVTCCYKSAGTLFYLILPSKMIELLSSAVLFRLVGVFVLPKSPLGLLAPVGPREWESLGAVHQAVPSLRPPVLLLLSETPTSWVLTVWERLPLPQDYV